MSKEIMQQALDALEGFAYHGKAEGWPETITALRAALAAPQPEPVAWMMVNREHPTIGGSLQWTPPSDWHITWEARPLYTAPPAAPSVPEPPHHAACSTTRGGDCDCWYIQPAGWRLVPVEPTKAHLNSIAMRHDHRFGLLPPEQQENARSFARQMYEECIGRGFYKIDAAPSVTYGSIAERAADGKDAGLWPPAAPSGKGEK